MSYHIIVKYYSKDRARPRGHLSVLAEDFSVVSNYGLLDVY
jgi:hypothetical protein